MKKIMFNDKYGLTAAVLQGRKTMTRRVIPEKIVNHFEKQYGEVDVKHNKEYQTFTFFRCAAGTKPEDHLFVPYRILEPLKAAPYKIGEEIAVAQEYKEIGLTFAPYQDMTFQKKHVAKWGNTRSMKGWSNKMFVRADLMPNRIRITDIRVERLQDISDDDCLREGIIRADLQVIGHDTLYSTNNIPAYWYCDSARTAFATLMNKINGKGTWERNPWVFAYTFELVK